MSKTLDILVNIKYTENVKSILYFESEGVLGMAENGFWRIGILFLFIILAIIVLDIALFVSLVRPGDERRQMIVGKASLWSFTGLVGCFVIRFVENMIRGTAEGMNPFTMLATAAIMYFIFLMYFKRKYGG